MIDVSALIFQVAKAVNTDPALLAYVQDTFGQALHFEAEKDGAMPTDPTHFPGVVVNYLGFENRDGNDVFQFTIGAGVAEIEGEENQSETGSVRDTKGRVTERTTSVPLARLREIQIRRLAEAAVRLAVRARVSLEGAGAFVGDGQFTGYTLLNIEPIT